MKKDNSEDLSDETAVGLMRRLEKQRFESIEAFEKAGRTEQAESEKGELAVIQEFLPKLADGEATRAIVKAAVESAGVTSAKDMGRAMGAIMK